MKKYILQLLAAMCVMMAFCACNPAESKIEELETLVTEVETEYKRYSQEDWRGVNEAYVALITEMEQYDYDVEQRKRIGRIKGKYEAVAMKYTISNFSDIINDYANEMGEYADELKECVEGFIDELTKDIDGDSIAG
jgi:uncharacterized coiled-coil DUF342 family protein